MTTTTTTPTTRTTSTRTKGAVAVVALALVLSLAGFTGTAGAAPRPPLEQARAFCNSAIDQRVNGLALLRARVELFRYLDPAQKAQSVAAIDATTAELNGTYRSAVNAAATPTDLRAACSSVVVDLRIFLVFIPQVEYLAAVEALQNGEALLQARVNQLSAAGVDTAAMQARLDNATATLESTEATTLAITPASYNADPAGTRAQWLGVRASISSAFVDLVTVLRALEPLKSIRA